jgi:L-threonylcarbamoyladenylate synthase
MTNIKDEINKTIEVLRSGRTILYPTDTIWGIGCDAKNEQAVEKIIQIKKRDPHKSFIVLLDDANKLESYIHDVPSIAWDLIEFAENPLTIIFPNARNLAKNVINEDGSVGIRIIKSGFAHELIKRFRNPLVSTSANLSGKPAAITLEDIDEEILRLVDHICKVPDSGTGQASTIMRLEVNGQFTFIRK